MLPAVKHRELYPVLSARGIVLDDASEFDFSLEADSIRRFWAIVLAFAEQNGADEVHFTAIDEEHCLRIRINGQWEMMYPPPIDVRRFLYTCALEMLFGGLRSKIVHWSTFLANSQHLGRVVVETDDGATRWKILCGYNCLAFRRECNEV
jgi:hypothetical protein